jgi:hypothetical protein
MGLFAIAEAKVNPAGGPGNRHSASITTDLISLGAEEGWVLTVLVGQVGHLWQAELLASVMGVNEWSTCVG